MKKKVEKKWKKYGKLAFNDVWIAACCMDANGTLLTSNKHFELLDLIESVIL